MGEKASGVSERADIRSTQVTLPDGFTFTEDGPKPGPFNMAQDEALLRSAEAGAGGCRVYSWDGVWVSLGRFQNSSLDLLKPNETRWVLRPTGGKAVLHGHDVTVGLALPLAALSTPELPVERLSRSVKLVYTAIAKPLITALNACGLPASLAADTPFAGRGDRTADCFAHISPNDIVHRSLGVKVCGCALQLTPTAVLVQASIPFSEPLVDASQVIRNGRHIKPVAWDGESFAAALKEALFKTAAR